VALKNTHKLSLSKTSHSIEYFLKGKYKNPKLFSNAAQKYFAKKYYPMFDEKYADKLKEIFPHDREIITISLSKN
jgi:hypothetical protein